jgi:hypothetical protein
MASIGFDILLIRTCRSAARKRQTAATSLLLAGVTKEIEREDNHVIRGTLKQLRMS